MIRDSRKRPLEYEGKRATDRSRGEIVTRTVVAGQFGGREFGIDDLILNRLSARFTLNDVLHKIVLSLKPRCGDFPAAINEVGGTVKFFHALLEMADAV
jgi:hypothetical protein